MSNSAAALANGNDAPLRKPARSDARKPDGPPPRTDGRITSLYAPAVVRLPSLALYVLVGFVLYAGWRNREDTYLTAESGDGYALGIIGGILMLLLLLYPLRKSARFMRSLGPTKHWFRAHVVLGVVGPVCVIFHANFQLGSINSTVAFMCMLLVAGSGLVGRYFYTKIHYGLYGRRITLEKLHRDAAIIKEKLSKSVIATPQLLERLTSHETRALASPQGVLASALRVVTFGIRTRWTHFVLRRWIKRFLKEEARRSGWNAAQLRQRQKAADRYVAAHLGSIRKVAELNFYERLFSLWHVFHLPLFFMMLISGVVHVIAVHMY